jgi:sigma-B regulation protein RsbU (phosphoserine phosphatase)
MALLLAILRTLVDEQLEPADLAQRLNVQVCRHAPGSRFITLFYAVYEPSSGLLTYVSAGHMPPLVMRRDGACERLSDGGIALGMFEHSTYTAGRVMLQPDDLVAVYSDGITEAENPQGRPFDEIGLETALRALAGSTLSETGAGVVRAVERHTDEKKFADDLTILLLRRTAHAALN